MDFSRRPGYTLVELLTVIAVIGIIALVATSLLLGQQQFFKVNTFQAHNQAFTANALASLAEQVKTADHVVPSHDFTVNGSTSTYTSGLHTLILALPSIDGSGGPILASPQKLDYFLVTADPGNSKHLLTVIAPDAGSSRTSQTRTIHSNYEVFNAFYNAAPAGASPPSVVTVVLGGRGLVVNTPLAVSQVSIRMRNL